MLMTAQAPPPGTSIQCPQCAYIFAPEAHRARYASVQPTEEPPVAIPVTAHLTSGERVSHRPRPRRRSTSGGMSAGLWIGLIAGGAVLLLVVVVVIVILMMNANSPQALLIGVWRPDKVEDGHS